MSPPPKSLAPASYLSRHVNVTKNDRRSQGFHYNSRRMLSSIAPSLCYNRLSVLAAGVFSAGNAPLAQSFKQGGRIDDRSPRGVDQIGAPLHEAELLDTDHPTRALR